MKRKCRLNGAECIAMAIFAVISILAVAAILLMWGNALWPV